jgi:hypothetical protein
MKYAISLEDGLLKYDVTEQEFNDAKEKGQQVWVSTNDGLTYTLVTD